MLGQLGLLATAMQKANGLKFKSLLPLAFVFYSCDLHIFTPKLDLFSNFARKTTIQPKIIPTEFGKIQTE